MMKKLTLKHKYKPRHTKHKVKQNAKHNKNHKTKKIVSARMKINYNYNYDNPNMKNYEPIFTIIENPDKTKHKLEFNLMRNFLKRDYHLTECNQYECMKRKVMFVWFNYEASGLTGLKRRYYNTQIYLINSITNIDSVASKEKLHLNMKEHFPEIYKKHMAQSFLLSNDWKLPAKSVFIARPINLLQEHKKAGELGSGYSGKDIVYISDEDTLKQAKELLKKYDNMLISDYITNPLLFKKCKFHIRTYLLASVINNEYNTYMVEFGRIYTAKLPYITGDWNNHEIHDTHVKSTPVDWFFPSDFTSQNMGTPISKTVIKDIFDQIRNIFIGVSDLLSRTVGLYDNIKNGFDIFGVDLMIRDDFTVVLIECNDKGGYTPKSESTRIMIEKLLFNWINDVIFRPAFQNKKPIDHKPLFTKRLVVNYLVF